MDRIEVKIRNEISSVSTYIMLAFSLTPQKYRGISIQELNKIVLSSIQFAKGADKPLIINKGPKVLNTLEPLFKIAKKNFPPKKPIEEIAEAYNEYSRVNIQISSNGIEFGWLQKYIDCRLIFEEQLPYHTRVGILAHAGNFAIEEQNLLIDAFFLLVLAEDGMAKINTIVKRMSILINPYDEKVYKEANAINTNVCMFSRLGILTLYSFVEAFVNSVGYDFLQKNKESLSKENIEILMGKKKGRYLTLESKLELFHKIIRGDNKQVFTTDKDKDPFKTFLNDYKNLRDSSVHYMPTKEPIWRKPADWISKINEYSQITIEISIRFWKACYPHRKNPDYLLNLDYAKIKTIGRDRNHIVQSHIS